MSKWKNLKELILTYIKSKEFDNDTIPPDLTLAENHGVYLSKLTFRKQEESIKCPFKVQHQMYVTVVDLK
jgi:hypothetical protein